MPSTPWGEDPSTFHEPWCLECGANTKQACICDEEAFTAREGDGGDYQLVSNTLRRRLEEYNRANPKRSGEALSALAVWHYLHEKAGKSGTTYELSYADICFDLGLITESGAAKAKRLKELISVLVEIGALYVERATYRTLSGSIQEGGYHYTPSLIVITKAAAFYTWTLNEEPVFYCHTCRPDDLGEGGGLITDLAGDVVKCSHCQKELQ